jgi:DNA-binding transcriptional LysR family regulator
MDLLNYSGSKAFSYWSFTNTSQQISIEPRPIFSSNNYYAIYKAAYSGLGVANLYQYMVDDDIKNGKLIELLPDWQQPSRDLFGVFQQRRDTSPKLDAFLFFMVSLFNS